MNNQLTAAVLILPTVAAMLSSSAALAEVSVRDAWIAKRMASSISENTRSTPSRRSLLEEKSSSRSEEIDDEHDGRAIKLYVPKSLPPVGQRAMVTVYHGGGANGSYMQAVLNMDVVADRYGFVVAYLNGTKAAKLLPSRMRSWNAGDCCGLAAEIKVDDVGYITNAIAYLSQKYGIDPRRIYAIGHSNGSLVSQLMACTTSLFQASVAISGPLSSVVASCPAAHGKRILAIHGVLDENVPISGGRGTKGPNKVRHDVIFRSEASAKEIYERSGAIFTLDAVEETDHSLQNLDEAITKRDGAGISEKAARFFGLAN